MNYAGVKADFLALLTRRDITPSQVDTFMRMALAEINRVLRVPSMEKTAIYTVDENYVDGITLPTDFLELLSIHSKFTGCRPYKLRRADLGIVLEGNDIPGAPTIFCRMDGKFLISQQPAIGTKLYVDYYASASALSNDTDTNWVTTVAPELLTFGGLKYAAIHFSDSRGPKFEQTFTDIAAALAEQSYRDELSGPAAISPMAGYDE